MSRASSHPLVLTRLPVNTCARNSLRHVSTHTPMTGASNPPWPCQPSTNFLQPPSINNTRPHLPRPSALLHGLRHPGKLVLPQESRARVHDKHFCGGAEGTAPPRLGTPVVPDARAPVGRRVRCLGSPPRPRSIRLTLCLEERTDFCRHPSATHVW